MDIMSLSDHVNKLVGNGKTVASTFQQGYDALVEAIIRPPRSIYSESSLGPKRFMFAGRVYHRQDLDIQSHRPDRCMLKCSHFKPEPKEGERPLRRPVVIFCHGNAASRQEGLHLIRTVLAASADLFLFDFGGSGLSEGEYVSLGHFEKEDLAAVVERLRSLDYVSSIALWGRSMGAVTALLYAVRDATISGMVLDSPFSDLRTLAGELCEKETFGAVPAWLADAALSVVKVSIQQRAGFDLDELCPVESAPSTFIPALFATGVKDEFIYPHHGRMIQEQYGGESRLVSFEGDHNSDRPKDFLDNVRKFFMRTLHSTKATNIWQFYDEKPVVSRLSAEDEALRKEKLAQALEKINIHREMLIHSNFGAEEEASVLEPPSPDAAEMRAQAAKRSAAEARARERQARHSQPTSNPRAPATAGSAGYGHQSFAAQQIAAPSLDKRDIQKQLSALGFSMPQIEAAIQRNSTLEGCVEWILTSS